MLEDAKRSDEYEAVRVYVVKSSVKIDRGVIYSLLEITAGEWSFVRLAGSQKDLRSKGES